VSTDHTYKITEIVGTSPVGISEAIRNGIDRAAATLRDISWFEVTDIRGHIADGAIKHFQVSMKLGFALED
jgi:flavin-binding protein dodecin